MKLKYILPIATIASVATIVTPLVTSCGSGATCTWKKGETYKPLTPKAAHEYEDRNALTVAYQADVKANKKIYSDDKVYMFSKVTGEDTNIKKVSYTTKKVSDIEKYETNNETMNIFRVDFSATIDATFNQSGIEFKYENRKFTATNIPLACNYQAPATNESVSGVIVSMGRPAILEDKKWTINMPEIVKSGATTNVGSKNIDYNATKLSTIDDPVLKPAIQIVINLLTGVSPSNYYSNITTK